MMASSIPRSGMSERIRALASDVCSASMLGCVGDLICQLGAERRSLSLDSMRWRKSGEEPIDQHTFDPRRLASLTFFGGVYIGGFLHFVYKGYPLVVQGASRCFPLLPSTLRQQLLDKGSTAHTLGCACIDNVHNGAIYLPAFFFGAGLLQGDSLREVSDTARREWPEAYGWCTAFWLPFTWVNFSMVLPVHRVNAMATANLVWSVALDYLTHRGTSQVRVAVEQQAARRCGSAVMPLGD